MGYTIADLLTELTIANSLGCWLVASWIFCFLWSVELVCAFQYFRTYKNDPWQIRCLVSAVLLAGTIKAIATCCGCYRQAIREFGNYLQAIVPGVEMSLVPLMTGFTSLLVQSFLLWRFWKISKQWQIALAIEAVAVVAFGFCIWGVTSLVHLSQLKLELRNLEILPNVVYSMQVFVDVSIVVALIAFLSQFRNAKQDSTRSVLSRLILVALQTGGFVSALAIATLVAFAIHPHSQLAVPFSGSCGYAQALCLLYNLNLRQVRGKDAAGEHGSSRPSLKVSPLRTPVPFGGPISYHQETITFTDLERIPSESEKAL